MRFRRHGDLGRRALVEPPEELGDSERQAALARPAPRRRFDRLGLRSSASTVARIELRRCRERASRCRRCRAAAEACRSEMLTWAEQVTAGITSSSERTQPDWARRFSRGANESSLRVSPTALIRTSGCNFIRGSVSLSRPGESHDRRSGSAFSRIHVLHWSEILESASGNGDSDRPRLFPLIRTCPAVLGPTRIARREATRRRCCARNEQSSADESWWKSQFLRGVELFNAGYYWEAHEVWEELWHAEGRRGPTADVLKALIKLAAAGVKVREGRENGVRTHCRRAAASVRGGGRAGRVLTQLGLDLDLWAERAREWRRESAPRSGPARCRRLHGFSVSDRARAVEVLRVNDAARLIPQTARCPRYLRQPAASGSDNMPAHDDEHDPLRAPFDKAVTVQPHSQHEVDAVPGHDDRQEAARPMPRPGRTC